MCQRTTIVNDGLKDSGLDSHGGGPIPELNGRILLKKSDVRVVPRREKNSVVISLKDGIGDVMS